MVAKVLTRPTARGTESNLRKKSQVESIDAGQTNSRANLEARITCKKVNSP